jgi:hypothetical protein
VSDVLARLADRALDAAGGLRPRIPARFEPAAGEHTAALIDRSRTAGPEMEGVEAQGEPANVRPVRTRPATSPRVAMDAADPPGKEAAVGSRRVPPASVRSETVEAPRTQQALAQPVPALGPGPLQRRAAPPAIDGRDRPGRGARGSVPAAIPAARNQEPTPPIAETAGAPPGRPPERRPDGPAPQSQPAVREVAAKAKSPRQRPRATVARIAGTADAPVSPGPLPAAPGVSPMPQRPVPMSTQVERPVVHVSIGRIEVRAVSPPVQPTPQRPRAPTAAPSLEAYLRARNGGSR